MSTHSSCPNCHRIDPNAIIYQCSTCNLVFCGNCSGVAVFMAKCPRCGGSGGEIGRIEDTKQVQIEKEEREMKAKELYFQKQQELDSKNFSELESRIQEENEANRRLLEEQEEQRQSRQDAQREYANNVFYYTKVLERTNQIDDLAVRTHYINKKIARGVRDMEEGHRESDDFQVKLALDKLTNRVYEIINNNPRYDTSLFVRYEKSVADLNKLESSNSGLKKPEFKYGGCFIVFVGWFIISFFGALLQQRSIGGLIAAVILLIIVGLGIKMYVDRKKSNHNKDLANYEAIKQSISEKSKEVDTLKGEISRQHPSYFNYL